MVSRDNMCDFSDVMGPFLFKVVNKVTKVIWNYNYGKNISVRNKNHDLRFQQFNKGRVKFHSIRDKNCFRKVSRVASLARTIDWRKTKRKTCLSIRLNDSQGDITFMKRFISSLDIFHVFILSPVCFQQSLLPLNWGEQKGINIVEGSVRLNLFRNR